MDNPSYRYWKVRHKPSGQYLNDKFNSNVLHTSRIGSKFNSEKRLKTRLNSDKFKTVRGVIDISFDKEDFELLLYFVHLEKTVPI